MRITQVRTVQVQGGPRKNWLFVLVDTDEGLTGLGEATLENWCGTVAQAVVELSPLLIGQDPTRIEYLWQSMQMRPFWRGGASIMSAISGIEIALWDIRGQSLGVPIYDLLGGRVRDRVRAYTHVKEAEPGSAAEAALARREEGWTAVKVTPLKADRDGVVEERAAVRRAFEVVHAVRAAVGPEMDIMVDGHGRFVPATALYFADAIRECQPLFFEEPVPPGSLDALARVQAKSPIPLAAGERLYGRTEFREVIERGLVEYVQPDVCHAGGILETKRIAAAAETQGIRLTPHNPLSAVATLASLHVGACTPNSFIQEVVWEAIPWWFDLLDCPPRFADGYLELPTGPGLGARLVEAVVAAHPPQAVLPIAWRSDDGAVAEW